MQRFQKDEDRRHLSLSCEEAAGILKDMGDLGRAKGYCEDGLAKFAMILLGLGKPL